MRTQLKEILDDPKLRTKIVEKISNIYKKASEFYEQLIEEQPYMAIDHQDELTEDDPRFAGDSIYCSQAWSFAWSKADAIDDYYECLDEILLQPYKNVSPSEMADCFKDIFFPAGSGCSGSFELRNSDFNSLYSLFIEKAVNQILIHNASEPIPLCNLQCFESKLTESPDFRDLFDNNVVKNTLWKDDGIWIYMLPPEILNKMSHPLFGDCYKINVIIQGLMSKGVCKDIERIVKKLLPSVINSSQLLACGHLKFNHFNWDHEEAHPLINPETLSANREKIEKMFEIYFSVYGKKEQMNNRIQNALKLQIESDQQEDEAIQLALSVAALEALLGDSKTELSEKLSNRISAILEPLPEFRYKAKMYFKKKVYEARSKALHGDVLKDGIQKELPELKMAARHLATACMFAIISRNEYQKRSTDKIDTPDVFIKSLDKAFAEGRPADYVEEEDAYNVSHYWRPQKES